MTSWMRQGRLGAMTALCLALGACSLAPTYHRPAAPVPDQFPLAENAAGPSELPAWRDVFRDPRLQALIELALRNNRDLRIAVENVEAARAQFGIVQSDRLPTIGVQGTEQASHSPENMRNGGANSPAVNRSFVAGVGMTAFELDFFGRVRNLSESAYQQFLSTEQARRTVQLSLIAQTAEAYFNLRSAQALHDLMEKTLQARQGSLDLVKVRFDVGVASDLDLAQAQSQLDTVRADLVAAERAMTQATNALQLILGAPVPADLPAPLPFGRDQLLQAIPAGLPSQLLERRPDIIGAENGLKAANAEIGAARAAFFPRITLTGLLGFASPELGGLFAGSQRYWQFSPQIQMPLFSGGVKGNLDLAKAQDNIAVATYEKAIQTAFREVADGLAGEATYSRQLDAVRATEASTLRALNLAQVRYETGVDSYLQVQTAQVNLYGVQQQFIQLGAAALANRVELYKALGGGWSPDDLPAKED
ncbi:efflux transporter outer membrane subunit [uncultured Castellaniella sp.]|uniref:efflux transporter outer membrane subunit n=1 Tax=uncultured Castellaniella sp. TaxID=647907 RepID=UPI0026157B54|nr:efflux transporter outer membrane subunit [uncultured Castellaniella sp.]